MNLQNDCKYSHFFKEKVRFKSFDLTCFSEEINLGIERRLALDLTSNPSVYDSGE